MSHESNNNPNFSNHTHGSFGSSKPKDQPKVVYIAVQVNCFEAEAMEQIILGVYDEEQLALDRNDEMKAGYEGLSMFFKVIPTVINEPITDG